MTTELPERGAHQRGVYLVEFAILAAVFFLFVFALLELARAVYLWNMVHEVTRRAARAAAVSDFSSASRMQGVRAQAVLRAAPGQLPLGGGISDDYVRIDYLSLADGAGGLPASVPVTAMPACPQRNRINCLTDPHGASCIRFVRARLCLPGDAQLCDSVPYRPILPMLQMMFPGGAQAIGLPVASTVVVAESLGQSDNSAFCP